MTKDVELRVRELAERHVSRHVSEPPWDPDSYEAEHVERIVARVLAALDGTDEEPWTHSHADTELGVCTECDAAAVLWWLREDPA